jgi:hypothetical protein
MLGHMNIRERARDACDLLRSAVAHRRAGHNRTAKDRATEASLIITEVLDEIYECLDEIRERVTAAVRDARPTP